jgi:NAD(P)-dependent dehydrogenase (short-subunit alcohol dehydrogenase family)/CMP-N-acetylneuraminic acid synthetase
MRPAKLATDTAPTLPVLKHALEQCEKIYKEKYDILIDLPVTAPVRNTKDLEGAYKLFKKEKPKNLVTVAPSHRNPYFNMLEEGKKGRVHYSKDKGNFTRRQDAPEVYDMNNSIYIYDTGFLRKEGKDKISEDTVAYKMEQLSAIDIDTDTDFKVLESLVKSSVLDLGVKPKKNIFSLEGKTAFVNGGAGLIGSEVVKALSESGAEVVLLDINKARALKIIEEIKEQGGKGEFELFDATKLNSADKAIDILVKKYGRIDVWVNTSFPRTPDWGKKVDDLPLKSFEKNVSMHLNSYSWISRKICLVMKKQKGGSLINFGSIYGVVGPTFNIYEGTDMTSAFAYAPIKGGIINLDRYLASYFGPDGVRVNTVCPGGVFDNQNPKFVKNYENQVPLKRMARPADLAGPVVFLASDASSYVTGATIMVDGGWTAV